MDQIDNLNDQIRQKAHAESIRNARIAQRLPMTPDEPQPQTRQQVAAKSHAPTESPRNDSGFNAAFRKEISDSFKTSAPKVTVSGNASMTSGENVNIDIPFFSSIPDLGINNFPPPIPDPTKDYTLVWDHLIGYWQVKEIEPC